MVVLLGPALPACLVTCPNGDSKQLQLEVMVEVTKCDKQTGKLEGFIWCESLHVYVML